MYHFIFAMLIGTIVGCFYLFGNGMNTISLIIAVLLILFHLEKFANEPEEESNTAS